MQGERQPVARERAIAALSTSQFGVVTRRQLLSLGLGDGAINHRITTGRLRLLHRGVYAVGHPVLRREGHWLAAVLACGPGAVLSHRTAAALWDLRASNDARIDVTSPRRSRRDQPGIDLHLPRRLAPNDITEHNGIPATTPSRTLADLAAVVDEEALWSAIRRAEQLELLDITTLMPHLRPGRPGAAALRRLLAGYDENVLLRSKLERRFLGLCRNAGLPTPRCNDVVHGLEVDFHWPQHALVVETDGYETHRTRHAFESDRARDAALARAGIRVLRFSWRQVTRDPATVAATLAPLTRLNATV